MVHQTMTYRVHSVGISDIGLVRENNEDVWLKLPAQRFFALADGMGGHLAGEIASRETLVKLCGLLSKKLNNKDESIDLVLAAEMIADTIKEVNKQIYQMSRANGDLRGMGTTLCVLHFHPKGLVYGHVGDSRIYRFRHNKLQQLTKDHSLLRELLDLGEIKERHAGQFAYKNIITKAIGTELHVDPSVRVSDIDDQDLFLMCTDGLSDMVSSSAMEEVLSQKIPLKEMAQMLVDLAKANGGYDNITLVLAKVQEIHDPKDLSR